MKRIIILVALAAALPTSCSPEMDSYERALDSDREAREKLATVLVRMGEAATLEAGGDASSAELVAGKRGEAVVALTDALVEWENAEELYGGLIKLNPERAVYYNNLGNLLLNKALGGLDADLNEARRLFTKALELEEREFYRRNLEMLDQLESDAAGRAGVESNRKYALELVGLAKAQYEEERRSPDLTEERKELLDKYLELLNKTVNMKPQVL